MGTRFMTTQESPLHENYKKLAVEKDVYDTIFSDRFDGLLCRIMKTEAAKRAVRKGLNLPAAFFNSRDIARQMNVPYWKMFFGVLASGWQTARQLAYMANAFKMIKVATEEGDTNIGVLPVGQVQGLIHDVPTVAELMARMVAEAESVNKRLTTIFTS